MSDENSLLSRLLVSEKAIEEMKIIKELSARIDRLESMFNKFLRGDL